MSAAGYALTRLRSLQAARGWLGLARFLMTRLLRSQSDVVFECRTVDQGRLPAEGDFGDGRRLVVINRKNLDAPERASLLAELLAGESAVYRAELERGDMALAVIDEEGALLHRSFIQFETRYKSILGEAEEVPLIANCHTVPRARGERLYPKTLRYAMSHLARHGHDRAVIITCDPQNTSSIRGIINAGFQQSRAITSLFILFRLVIQRIDWSDHRTTWRMVMVA